VNEPTRPAATTTPESTRAREHLANERTLLAWVRTAVALMGLGFVVARFGLFLREVAGRGSAEPAHVSAIIGATLVGASILVTALSTARFMRARAQIERGAFVPEVASEVVLVAVTVAAGLALLVYLILTG
jgi:putative membrane protein